jgi:glycerol uptake facilitator-like aquaporin
VTVELLAVRKISPRDALIYIVCQLVGGVLAGLLVLLLFSNIGKAVNYGTPALNHDVLKGGSVWLGLVAEGLGVFILMWAIMGLAVNPKGESALAGVGIGGALGVAVMVFGPATGGSLNPARWLGPAIASGDFSDFWVYILAPLIGTVCAALGYRAIVLERRGLAPQEPREEIPG